MHLVKPKRATKPSERTMAEQKEIDRTLTLLTGKAYTNAAQTNIVDSFRKMGWTPPSELRKGRFWLPKEK